MSPLVERNITTINHRIHSKRERAHVSYVPPTQLKAGDKIVRPTSAQLAELKQQYPDEYEEKDSLGFREGPYKVAADKAFLEVPWGEAVAQVQAAENAEDNDRLADLFEMEKTREPYRKSVMKALHSAGVEGAREFFE